MSAAVFNVVNLYTVTFSLQHLDFVKLIVSFKLLESRKLHFSKSSIMLAARSFTVASMAVHLENFKQSTSTKSDIY